MKGLLRLNVCALCVVLPKCCQLPEMNGLVFLATDKVITHWSFCDLVYIKETAQCNHDCCTCSGVNLQGAGVLG